MEYLHCSNHAFKAFRLQILMHFQSYIYYQKIKLNSGGQDSSRFSLK